MVKKRDGSKSHEQQVDGGGDPLGTQERGPLGWEVMGGIAAGGGRGGGKKTPYKKPKLTVVEGNPNVKWVHPDHPTFKSRVPAQLEQSNPNEYETARAIERIVELYKPGDIVPELGGKRLTAQDRWDLIVRLGGIIKRNG